MEPLTLLERQRRTVYLTLLCIVLVTGWITRWGIRFSFWGCPFVQWFGIPCMGWGMSRSVYATAQGDLMTAIQFHLFGPLLLVGATIVSLHLSLELLRNQAIYNVFSVKLKDQRSWLFGLFILLGYHLTRLITLYHSGQLQTWIQQSHLGKWL